MNHQIKILYEKAVGKDRAYDFDSDIAENSQS